MKISQLLEGNLVPFDKFKAKEQFIELTKQYPIMYSEDFITAIITNLPKTLSQEQLNELCKVSFSPQDYQYIIDNNSIELLSDGALLVQRWIEEMIDCETTAENWTSTWKQFVEEVNSLYSEDNDFK